MRVLLFILVFLFFAIVTGKAQKTTPPLNMKLQPFRMVGQDNPLRRNLSFDNYKTSSIRRTLGSYFSFGNFSLLNPILEVGGVPLYKKDKNRSKDVFRFELEKNDTLVSITECRAIMRKNETFHLFSKQDSSFFGANNTDLLEARIQLGQDTSNIWQVVGSNLNGSKEEEQKGIVCKGNESINFVKTVLLLREKSVDRTEIEGMIATVNLVYSFTYNNEIVAAVSFKETDRKIWFKQKLDENIKTVIASTACILTLRRELYY